MKIKVWCLILAAALAAFAGCSKTSGAAETSAETAAPRDLGGYEFIFAGADALNPSGEQWRFTSVADRLAEIYGEIESEYGCKIKFTELSGGAEAVIAAVSSGTPINGFAQLSQNEWIPLLTQGALLPLDTNEMRKAGLDVNDAACFYQPYTHLSDFALDGEEHTYGVDLSGAYIAPDPGYLYAFNKVLTAAAGYPAESVFKLVYDGQWTYEKMFEIAVKISKDSGGARGNFGIALGCPEGEALSNGAGPVVYNASDGKWKANLADRKFTTSLDFIKNVSEAGDLSGLSEADRVELFLEGRAGFLGVSETGGIRERAQILSSGNPFGFLPVPKGPDAEGYTLTRADARLFCMPASCAEPDKAAYLIDKISRKLQSGDEYLKYLKTYVLLDCEDSYRVVTEYLLPNAALNTAGFGGEANECVSELYGAVLGGTVAPENAAEAFGAKLQSALEELFAK
jgi:ABC-type glycerol-3-phosphate transport system substrate-binding protein